MSDMRLRPVPIFLFSEFELVLMEIVWATDVEVGHIEREAWSNQHWVTVCRCVGLYCVDPMLSRARYCVDPMLSWARSHQDNV